jgi:hypothetical protein
MKVVDYGERRDASRARFKLTRFDQITPSTASAYLVKGLVPRGGLIVVWGAPKCGKSFWTLDVAMHVARGVLYRGRRVKQGTVVYLALEGGEGFARRIEAYRRQHKVDTSPFHLITDRIDLISDHKALIAAVREQIGDDGAPVLIVIDTLNRSLVGSESSDEDMAAYGRAADAIREAFDCAAIIVHHCGVDGSRPRGHTSLGAAVDALLAVSRDGEENVVVTVEAVRDGEDGDVIGSRLEKVEIGTDEDGDPMTSCVVLPVEIAALAMTTCGRKETDAQRVFREAFTEALIVGGQLVRVRGDGPTVKATKVEIVRQQFYARWATGEVDAKKRGNAQRQAFRRGLRGAKAAGYATWVHDDVEWMSDPKDKRRE